MNNDGGVAFFFSTIGMSLLVSFLFGWVFGKEALVGGEPPAQVATVASVGIGVCFALFLQSATKKSDSGLKGEDLNHLSGR